MEKEEYSKMYNLETDYWWFKAKRELVDSWINRECRNNKNLKLLDVGCGTGIIMKMLEKYGVVYGLDASDESLSFCKKRDLKNIEKGSVENIPYANDCFDIVTALDVLYHENIKDDETALKEIHRILKKNGIILITDSAMKCLWSRHDIAVHAKRRYSANELKRKLKMAGFKVEKISYFNTLLFIPVFISRKFNNLFGQTPKSDIQKINYFFNKLLYLYYSFELSLLKYFRYPFGVSVFAVGRKTE